MVGLTPQPHAKLPSMKAARMGKFKIFSLGSSNVHLQKPQIKTGQMSWPRLFTDAMVEFEPINLILTI